MPDSKGLAHLRINAAGYGLNAMLDIEDDVARAAAQSNHDAITDLAQQLAGDEADILDLQAKDAEIDATILQIDARDDGQDTQINALQDKTQLYSVVGGANVNHRILQLGTGLEVNNNVLSVTGGGSGGDISALTARVEALETNDGVQDSEISTLQTTTNTLGTVQTSQGNAISALQTSDTTQNSDIADIKAALQAADLSGMATRLTAVEVKNAQQDTAIANKSDVHVGALGNTIPEVHLDGDQFTGDYQTGAVAINTIWLHNTIAGDTSVTGLATRVGDLETHDTVQDGQIQQIINAGLQYKTALRTQETQGGQTVDVNHTIVYVEGDLTIAEGTGNREILKLNPNGAAMTDISDLKTRMTTAEGDIDGCQANDITLSMQKTGLYTNSGGTNAYYTDLALGAGLAVTNGVLDVTGGGGGSAGYDVTGVSNANTAADGFSYPLANATNFPPAVKLGTNQGAGYPYPETLLITTTWPTGQTAAPDGKMQVCIYKDNVYTRQRYYTSNPSAPDYPYYWTAWTTSAYSKAVEVNNANSVPLVSGLYTKGTGTLSNWPTGSGTGVLFHQLLMTDAEITSATDGNVATVQTFTQADKIWVRSGTAVYDDIFGNYINYGAWTEISGGGGGAGYDIAATSDANSAATGWTYPATGATNFPSGVELGISSGTYRAPKTMLLTTDFNTGDTDHPAGKMQVCIYGTAIYTRQRSVDSNPSSATGYTWSDWIVSAYSTAKQTAYVDAITESGLYKPTATTSLPTGASTDGVLFAQMVLTPADLIAANVGNLAQIQQYTTASGIWIRTGVVGGYNPFTQQYGIQFGTWAQIGGGGGDTGPTKIAAGTDLDTITDAGEYYFNGGNMPNMPQWPGMVAPSSGEGNTPYFLTVRKRPFGGDSGSTYLIEQEIAATDNASVGFVTSTKNTIRHISRVKINNGSWSSWVSQDTAMTCADCNLACRTGKYWITGSTSNKPSGMGSGDIGVMEVSFENGTSGYVVIQRITTANKIYVRNNTTAGYNTQGSWNAWKSVTLS